MKSDFNYHYDNIAKKPHVISKNLKNGSNFYETICFCYLNHADSEFEDAFFLSPLELGQKTYCNFT